MVGVYLNGAPRKGVGPQDVALAIIGAVFANGYVKNKVMEFVGPGVANLERRFPDRRGRDDHRDHLPVLHLERPMKKSRNILTFTAAGRSMQS